MNRVLMTSFFLLLLSQLCSCTAMETVTALSADLGATAGLISHSQADAIKRSSKSLHRSFAEITPEQEHYIGRAVGATILSRYQPVELEEANKYLNALGQLLAQASDRPETFAGYRFLLLEGKEVNAFAAPGGLVFVTRGMLACCPTEDALAAVLAHEIAHIHLRHGLRAIKSSRLTSALTTLAAEGVKAVAGEEVVRLTEVFEESISDITQTLINNGYSSTLEKEADLAAVTILRRVGYSPAALLQMLGEMESRVDSGGWGFGSTHPPPQVRREALQNALKKESRVVAVATRQARFIKAFEKL